MNNQRTTKEKILKSAIELFSGKGYDSTTIRDICSNANANISSVNYHFKGKIGLGDAVLDYLFDKPLFQHKTFLSSQITTEEEWKSGIYDFIYNFISDRDKEGERNYHRSQLIFKELNNPTELFKKMYEHFLFPTQQILIKYIKKGLPKETSKEIISMWVITIMSQCVMFRKKQKAEMQISYIDFSKSKNVKKVATHIANIAYLGLKFQKED